MAYREETFRLQQAGEFVKILTVSFVLMLASSVCEVYSATTNPNNTLDYSLIYPSIEDTDVILGALFPLHSLRRIRNSDSCGHLQEEDGILPLEAMLFTLDQVNADPDLLPNIRLGMLALDSCNSPDIALQQSLRFIKGFIASQNAHHETEFQCADRSTPIYKEGNYDKVVGVVGAQHSSVSVQMANVLRLFKVPQISYRSTSASLSQRDRFPYFLRTVPTDNNQAEVILKVLEYLNISYASLVYSDTEYGRGGYNELMKKAKYSSVCFATPVHSLKLEDPKEAYESVFKTIVQRERTKAVVLFSDMTTAAQLFEVANTSEKKFLWIGSDGWTTHARILDKYSDVIEGAIGIQPMAKILPGFEDYFRGLTPASNTRNPWFREFWEAHFNCDLANDRNCAAISLRKSNKYVDTEWLHFVRDSVYAFAHGLHAMWEDKCQGTDGLCHEMAHDGHVHGQELYEYLRNVTFKDVTNQTFRFQESGAGTPRYTVFGYRKNPERNLWIPIANFTYDGGVPFFSFLEAEAKWRQDSEKIPESFCGKRCGPRQAKIIEEETCCWHCEDCLSYQYLNQTTKFCDSCDTCHKPDELGLRCVSKQERYLDYRNQWAITSMAFASLGIFSTVFVGIIFWVHLDTPVIRAASRELSYILLVGIFLSFGMTFAILAPPTPLSCGFTRFFLGFSYTLCYSAVLTKTNRISRIFNKNPSKSNVKTRYTSPTSQMVIVLLLVCVEIIINLSWLMYYKPEVKTICGREELHNILICKGIDDISYIVGFIYPLFLVCLCTIYAIKTRKCPGGFNEARYIAFTNYTTCIIWLVFVPLYLTTPAKDGVRIVSLSMSLSLGGFVQLACLFFPKVHIVLFKPEKNTRDAVMSQPKGSSQGGGAPMNSIGRAHHHSAPSVVYMNGVGNPTLSLPLGNVSHLSTAPVAYSGGSSAANDSPPQILGKINPAYLSVPNPEHQYRNM